MINRLLLAIIVMASIITNTFTFALNNPADLSVTYYLNKLFHTLPMDWEYKINKNYISLDQSLLFTKVASIHADYFEIDRRFYFPITSTTPFFINIGMHETRDFETQTIEHTAELAYLIGKHLFVSIIGEPTYDKSYTDTGFTVRLLLNNHYLWYRNWTLNSLFNQKTQSNNTYSLFPTRQDFYWIYDNPDLILNNVLSIYENGTFNDNTLPSQNFQLTGTKQTLRSEIILNNLAIDAGIVYEYENIREKRAYSSYTTGNYQDRITQHRIKPRIKIPLGKDFDLENIINLTWSHYQRTASIDITSDNFDFGNMTILTQHLNKTIDLEYGYAILDATNRNKWGKSKLIFNIIIKIPKSYTFRIINSFHSEDIANSGIKWDGSGVEFFMLF